MVVAIRAGDYRHRVEVQSQDETRDANTGQVLPTAGWSTDSTRWANIMPLSGREAVNAKEVYSDVTHEIPPKVRFDHHRQTPTKDGEPHFQYPRTSHRHRRKTHRNRHHGKGNKVIEEITEHPALGELADPERITTEPPPPLFHFSGSKGFAADLGRVTIQEYLLSTEERRQRIASALRYLANLIEVGKHSPAFGGRVVREYGHNDHIYRLATFRMEDT